MSKVKVLMMSFSVLLSFVGSAYASTETLTNGPNGGCAGSVGCTITVSDGSSMYFSVYRLNPSTGVATSVNLWDYEANAVYSLGNGQWVQTSGTSTPNPSNTYRLTIVNAPVKSADGRTLYTISMTENFGEFYSRGGGGRGGGGAGWHYQVLNGSITFNQ
jgi:hypothetical protein